MFVRANRISPRAFARDHRERLSEAGMVDLLGMFRRRPAKRNPVGFARSREDITALGDTIGDMLSSPVRDAPPTARDAAMQGMEVPRALPEVEPPRAELSRGPARSAQSKKPPRPKKANGAGAAPQLL